MNGLRFSSPAFSWQKAPTSLKKAMTALPPSRGSLRPTRSMAWMPLAPS
jgi:hypothetical protein